MRKDDKGERSLSISLGVKVIDVIHSNFMLYCGQIIVRFLFKMMFVTFLEILYERENKKPLVFIAASTGLIFRSINTGQQ